MPKEIIDRGDELEATSDTGADTPDLEGQLETEDGTTEDEGTTKVETKEKVIPKKRFDQAVGKARKEAEASAARAEKAEALLKQQQGDVDAEKIEGEIDDLYDKADQAQADGNKELLKALRREIREKQQVLADARADVKAAYKSAQAIEQIRYDRIVEDMEKDHPELNPDNEDDYDEDAIGEIQDLTEAFVAKGEGSAAALKKAIKFYYKGAKASEKKEDETEEADGNARTQAAVKKGIETKGQQPPAAKAGMSSDKAGKKEKVVDVSKLSDDDFNKLSKEEKARARGDYL